MGGASQSPITPDPPESKREGLSLRAGPCYTARHTPEEVAVDRNHIIPLVLLVILVIVLMQLL